MEEEKVIFEECLDCILADTCEYEEHYSWCDTWLKNIPKIIEQRKRKENLKNGNSKKN